MENVGQQELLEAAQSLAGFGCFRWNLSSNYVALSDGFCRMMGLYHGAKDVSVDTFLQFFVPDDRELIRGCIAKAVDLRSRFHSTLRTQRVCDGEIRIIESRGQVIENDLGEVTWVVGACQDATVPHSTQESLRWQVAGSQLILDLSTHVLSSGTLQENLSFSLEGLAKHLGCDIYNYFGKTSEDTLELKLSWGLPESITDAISTIQFGEQLCGICASGDDVMHIPFSKMETHPAAQLLLPLGIKCFIGVPIISEGTRLGSLSFLSRTRTSFTESEIDFVKTIAALVAALKAKSNFVQELRDSEERQDIVLKTAKTVIWECNPDIVFTYVSDYCEELLGYPAEDWLQPGFWHSRLHPDDAASAISYCADEIKHLRDHHFEYRMIHKDGSIVWIEDTVKLVTKDGVLVAMRGALIDITQRKLLEQDLRQSQKMQAIGRLAGGIAHDFNNALTVISTYAAMMLNQLSAGDKNHNYVTAIQTASERAAALTTQLLIFGRKSLHEPKVLCLNEIVSQSETLLRRVIGEDIELKTKLTAGVSSIKSDQTHIEQTILNLAINARDAMPSGGTLSLETRVAEVAQNSQCGLAKGQYVELVVSDDGCGMSDETISRCFEPFYTTKKIGSGLGLSVTYGVVTESGGDISVESDPKTGTAFRILFPVADEQTSPTTPGHKKPAQVAAHTVMLVEDEASVRRVARMSLESGGFNVIEAANGAEALKKIEELSPQIDVLVTDLVMPGMNGQSLARKLRERFSGLRVLYISGYGQNDLASSIKDEPGSGFLQKPFSVRTLVDAIGKVLQTIPQKIEF